MFYVLCLRVKVELCEKKKCVKGCKSRGEFKERHKKKIAQQFQKIYPYKYFLMC